MSGMLRLAVGRGAMFESLNAGGRSKISFETNTPRRKLKIAAFQRWRCFRFVRFTQQQFIYKC